jgi:hypothetical protein
VTYQQHKFIKFAALSNDKIASYLMDVFSYVIYFSNTFFKV